MISAIYRINSWCWVRYGRVVLSVWRRVVTYVISSSPPTRWRHTLIHHTPYITSRRRTPTGEYACATCRGRPPSNRPSWRYPTRPNPPSNLWRHHPLKLKNHRELAARPLRLPRWFLMRSSLKKFHARKLFIHVIYQIVNLWYEGHVY